jgi:hypothetical protein
MRSTNVLYTAVGLAAGAVLTLATVATPIPSASAQPDAYHAAQKAQVIATIYHLDKSGLHDLDESLAAGAMPSGALGNVRRGKIAAMATDWPEPTRETAQRVIQEMQELETALRAEDVAKAAPLAKDVHDHEHDLSAAVYDWLAGGSGGPAHPSH